MTRFLIQYYSTTLASIASRIEQQSLPLQGWKLEFPSDNTTLILNDAIERLDDVNLHVGLNLILERYSHSREDAEADTKAIAENILNLITYSTLAFCGAARLTSITEFQEHGNPLFSSYIYPFDENEKMGSIVPVAQQEFREIFDAMGKTGGQERVARALSWLRKGINEENIVDEFAAYWIGLEVLKSILRRMLKMKSKKPAEWDGVKNIYVNELHFSDFDKVEKARDKLFHGFESLTTAFIDEIKAHTEPTRKTLLASLASVLGLPQPTRDSLQNKTVRRIRKKPWTVIWGEMENLPSALDEIAGNFPRISAQPKITYSLSPTGELEMKIEVAHQFHGPDGVSWHPTDSEQRADKDSGVRGIDVLS